MEVGLIGVQASGKTTIFNALSGQQAPLTGGYRQVHLAEVEVPDERVEKLADLFGKKKRVHATVLLKDLHLEFSGQGGIAPQSLAELRTNDAMAVVVRAFRDESVAPPLQSIDPARDLRSLLDSLIFSDYEIVDRRLERLAKEGRKGDREHAVLEKLAGILSQGNLIGPGSVHEDDRIMLAGFQFLTAKPLLVVANTGERPANLAGLEEQARSLGLHVFPLQGLQEMEISLLEPGDQQEFLADLGLEEPARIRFLKSLYDSLDLISFLTVGDQEVRAWSLPSGATALRAAGKIHTDMERGFIRAEVIGCDRLLEEGGFAQARQQGDLRLEGKDYTVRDGDVLTIRFNV